ncbi:hypothetical protein DFJ73DRAFT_631387 [Zopfochytrium polystomum]|nr:hypothetical protein DFJ73DRAFT_631387 [Zopfochytrium polystomum]
MHHTTTAAAISSNPLLVKDSVGKSRPTVYDLPPSHHVYGKGIERNPEECAAQVLHNWNVKAKSKHAVPSLDYISMNRNTAKHGIINPSEIREFRKHHPIRMKIGDASAAGVGPPGGAAAAAAAAAQRLVGPLPHDRDPSFTYGKPTRPSTPVATLMTDQYQQEWIMEQEKRNFDILQEEKQKAKKKQTKTVTPAKVPLPKRPLLVDKDPRSLFKLSRFTDPRRVAAKIVSWREIEDGAFAPIQDQIARLGIGSGVGARPSRKFAEAPAAGKGAAAAAAAGGGGGSAGGARGKLGERARDERRDVDDDDVGGDAKGADRRGATADVRDARGPAAEAAAAVAAEREAGEKAVRFAD